MDTPQKGWYSRGYLPHFDAPNEIQHITFRLADSLPKEAIERIQTNLRAEDDEEKQIIIRRRLDHYLKQGYGACILKRPDIAAIVENSLLFGDGRRYRLLAWTIMPNHVHILIEQNLEWPLAKVVQGWKRHTTKMIKALGDHTIQLPIWQREYWDRYIRNTRHYHSVMHYIAQNPVEAGLVHQPENWPWSSARFID